jgi:acetyltransferase
MGDYPKEWERREVLADGLHVLIRPLRAGDEALYPAFLAHLEAEDVRLRFLHPVREISPEMIHRFVSVDYERSMAFAIIDEARGELLGVARLHCDPFRTHGEYAILVRSDRKGHGLGWLLMQQLIRWARASGLERIHGQVFAYNRGMLQMCRDLGFEVHDDPSDRDIKAVTLDLTARPDL